MSGKLEAHACAGGAVFRPNPATVRLHDGTADRQTKPHAGFLAGFEGREDPLQHRFRNAGAVVEYIHPHASGGCRRAYFYTVGEDGQPVKPGEVGEILIQGYLVMQGYWQRHEDTQQKLRDGWLHTGDLATVDDAGYIFIVDRKDFMIISGGLNVYPKEVEDFLSAHPAVLQVAVLGVPHEKYGETVKAFVSLKQEASATEQELIDFCKQGLAGFKRPTVWSSCASYRSRAPASWTKKPCASARL